MAGDPVIPGTLCGHYAGSAGYCDAPAVAEYLIGPRCTTHTPAALAGRVDQVPDPDLTLDGIRARRGLRFNFRTGDTALNDDRARRSGRRASGERRRAQHQADGR